MSETATYDNHHSAATNDPAASRTSLWTKSSSIQISTERHFPVTLVSWDCEIRSIWTPRVCAKFAYKKKVHKKAKLVSFPASDPPELLTQAKPKPKKILSHYVSDAKIIPILWSNLCCCLQLDQMRKFSAMPVFLLSPTMSAQRPSKTINWLHVLKHLLVSLMILNCVLEEFHKEMPAMEMEDPLCKLA